MAGIQQQQQGPISCDPSDGAAHKQTTSTLPDEVVQCLKNTRFLHLATCYGNEPHIVLMNFTFLSKPAAPDGGDAPVIIMTSNPRSKKTNNIAANRNVSIQVHDWIAPRHTANSAMHGNLSNLADLLLTMNAGAVGRISACIGGTARFMEKGSPEEKYYLTKHLENVTGSGEAARPADEDVCVIEVTIRDVCVSDSSGDIKDWVLVPQRRS